MKNREKGMGSLRVLAIFVVLILIIGGVWYVSNAQNKPAADAKKMGILYIRQHLDAYNGIKEGMAKLGYNSRNLIYDEIEVDVTSPDIDAAMTQAAQKLVDDKVDVLWVSSEGQAFLSYPVVGKNGNEPPIVFLSRFHDPLAIHLIDSYKASGHNVTGIATSPVLTVQKNIQFFKEINPNAKKIGVFGQGFMVPNVSDVYLAELKKQAPKFGMTVVEYKNLGAPEFTGKLWHDTADKIKPGDIDALFHLAGHFYDPQEVEETKLAQRLHIPHAVPSEDLRTGGMFSYSDDYGASAAQSAAMVDKIFKGTKAGDIPVEFGAKSILQLNLKRAADGGVTFPRSMLDIADTKITN